MIEQALMLWIVGILATFGTRHDRTRVHWAALHCERCHSRRTLIRWGILAMVIVSVTILSQEVHASDVTFLLLAIAQEAE